MKKTLGRVTRNAVLFSQFCFALYCTADLPPIAEPVAQFQAIVAIDTNDPLIGTFETPIVIKESTFGSDTTLL
jgi:hypothetical protein